MRPTARNIRKISCLTQRILTIKLQGYGRLSLQDSLRSYLKNRERSLRLARRTASSKRIRQEERGYSDYGLDPSSTEVEFARRVNRLSNARTGVVEDLRGGKEKFDVIALFHVLEALGDPMTTLHILSDSLRDGGLVWIEVPDAAELKGDVIEFQHFISCQHLYEFSQTSLKAFLERAGFEEVLHEKAPLGFFLQAISGLYTERQRNESTSRYPWIPTQRLTYTIS